MISFSPSFFQFLESVKSLVPWPLQVLLFLLGSALGWTGDVQTTPQKRYIWISGQGSRNKYFLKFPKALQCTTKPENCSLSMFSAYVPIPFHAYFSLASLLNIPSETQFLTFPLPNPKLNPVLVTYLWNLLPHYLLYISLQHCLFDIFLLQTLLKVMFKRLVYYETQNLQF